MSETALPPQRLHPLTVILNLVGLIRAQIFPLGVVIIQIMRTDANWAYAALGLLVVAIFLWAWWSWHRFTYRIEADDLVIEGGVIRRFRRTIPLHRIQDISISQSFVQRLLGLNSATIEAAGGSEDEGALPGVNTRQIRELRAIFSGFEREGEEAALPDEQPPTTEIFSMSPRRVVMLGLLNPSLIWFAALVVIWQFGEEWLELDLFEWISDTADIALAKLSVAILIFGVAVLILVTLIAGIVRATLAFAGFRLTEHTGRFRARMGLFANVDTAVRLKSVQMAVVTATPMERLWRWQSLSLQTIGGSDGPSGRLAVAPLARKHEIAEILAIAGLPAVGSAYWRRTFFRHPTAQLLRYSAPLMVAGLAIGYWQGWAYGALIWVALAPVIVALAVLRQRTARVALNDRDLQARGGALRMSHAILPYQLTQSITFRQGPLQRLLGTMSVSLNVAGGPGIYVRDTDIATAMDIAGTIGERGWGHAPLHQSPAGSVARDPLIDVGDGAAG